MKNVDPRPIKSDLKSYRIHPEMEKPSRWSFLKILREYSTLKEFYPDINPYAEAYKFRDNTYCIFTEGLEKICGDMWHYLIIGPEKAMLIDTGFGVGNLKALCDKLSGGKELIVVNTHNHIDHCSGNFWFDKVWIHELDYPGLMAQMRPGLVIKACCDENGMPRDTYFDVNDLAPFRKYEVETFRDGHIFDLGDGYQIEAVHLGGHSLGQSAFFDHQTGCIFIGDTTSAMGISKDDPNYYYSTINCLRDNLKKLQPRFEKISGVFPGHGTIDLHWYALQYILDAAERIIAHPERWDTRVVVKRNGVEVERLAKMIYQQGSDLKYTMNGVIKEVD